MIEERLNQDLKQALLGGDKFTVNTIRTLKSVILYAKVSQGASREEPLADELLFPILQKEVKKRQESAALYQQGGSQQRADDELAEKRIIEQYLPKQLSEAEIETLVGQALASMGSDPQPNIGAVMARAKKEATGLLDGATLARIVKEKLQS